MTEIKVLFVNRDAWLDWSRGSQGIATTLAQIDTAKRLLDEARWRHGQEARRLESGLATIEKELKEVLGYVPSRHVVDGCMCVEVEGEGRVEIRPRPASDTETKGEGS